jgi:hypothetical protein
MLRARRMRQYAASNHAIAAGTQAQPSESPMRV